MRWAIIILPSYNVELLHFLAWLMLPSHGFCYTKRKIAYNNSYSIEFFSVFCTVVVRRLKITITYRLITYIFDSVSWIIRFYIKWAYNRKMSPEPIKAFEWTESLKLLEEIAAAQRKCDLHSDTGSSESYMTGDTCLDSQILSGASENDRESSSAVHLMSITVLQVVDQASDNEACNLRTV